jgi:hypothetical protein
MPQRIRIRVRPVGRGGRDPLRLRTDATFAASAGSAPTALTRQIDPAADVVEVGSPVGEPGDDRVLPEKTDRRVHRDPRSRCPAGEPAPQELAERGIRDGPRASVGPD